MLSAVICKDGTLFCRMDVKPLKVKLLGVGWLDVKGLHVGLMEGKYYD